MLSCWRGHCVLAGKHAVPGEFTGLMFPGSLCKTHPSTFNKLDADLWKLKPSSACCLCIIQDWRCSAGSAAPRDDWFNIVWTLFMKPSRKWPFFLFFFFRVLLGERDQFFLTFWLAVSCFSPLVVQHWQPRTPNIHQNTPTAPRQTCSSLWVSTMSVSPVKHSHLLLSVSF